MHPLIDEDLEVLNTDLPIEVPYGRYAVVLERERYDLSIVAPEIRLYAIQGRHFLMAGCGPSGPEVEQEHLPSEIGQAARLPLAINDADVLCPGARAR